MYLPLSLVVNLKLLSKTKVFFKNSTSALAGVAQWTECWLANQRVTGSIPSQGTCLGYGPGPHILMFLSLPFSLPSPLSKNKINKI